MSAPKKILFPQNEAYFHWKIFHIVSPGRLIFDVFHKFGLIFISLHISDCAPGNKIAKASGILSKNILFHQFKKLKQLKKYEEIFHSTSYGAMSPMIRQLSKEQQDMHSIETVFIDFLCFQYVSPNYYWLNL